MTPVWSLALKALVVAAFGALAVFAGSPLVGRVFRLADSAGRRRQRPDASAKPGATAEVTAEDSPGIQAAASALRGGRWIGMLERTAVYAAILTGFAEGIAIVLAVKGLARYPELQATTPGAAERFIIGTFVSVLFAAACAGLSWWVVGLW